MSNKDVKQDALDNLADALTEDILNTPDDEVLREVAEDYGDPRALANKFDQILERAEKQVSGTARSGASSQVRSSVLDLPYRLLKWFSTLFGSGPGRSETQFFSVKRMVWAGAAAALIVFILVPAFFSPQSETIWTVYETRGDLIRLAAGFAGFAGFAVCVWIVIRLFRSRPSVPSRSSAPTWGMAASSRLSEFLSSLRPRTLAWSAIAAAVVILVQAAVITAFVVKEQAAPLLDLQIDASYPSSPRLSFPRSPRLSDEQIAALVAGGRQLMVAGDIPNARLLLQPAAEADNATAALELGATYDPTILQQQKAQADMADIRMARLWYEKARDLGSTEAARRLERLAGRESQPR